MRDGDWTDAGAEARWRFGPSAKERTTVQGVVRRLLDDLAPERPPDHAARHPAAVECHRTPSGCIMQAATGAVTVSWFSAPANEGMLGELQVIVWRGVVSRPGSANRAVGEAVPVSTTVLRPEEVAGDAWAWRGADGEMVDSATLAARCRAFLDA